MGWAGDGLGMGTSGWGLSVFLFDLAELLGCFGFGLGVGGIHDYGQGHSYLVKLGVLAMLLPAADGHLRDYPRGQK